MTIATAFSSKVWSFVLPYDKGIVWQDLLEFPEAVDHQFGNIFLPAFEIFLSC